MISPMTISEQTGVPPSTIRRWAVRFAPELSKQDSKKRMYTIQDLNVFMRIREYSRQGKSLDNIADKLKTVASKVDTEQKPETGLMIHPEVAKLLQDVTNQNVALQLQLDKNKEQLDKMQAQVAWLLLPFWKRIGKQMPE